MRPELVAVAAAQGRQLVLPKDANNAKLGTMAAIKIFFMTLPNGSIPLTPSLRLFRWDRQPGPDREQLSANSNSQLSGFDIDH